MSEYLLNKIKEQLVDVITQAGYGLCLIDENYKVIWANSVFNSWFNVAPDISIYQLIEEKESQENSQIINSLTGSGEKKLEIKHPSTNRWFMLYSTELSSEESNSKYYLLLLDDTTEKKHLFENYFSQLAILDNVEDGIYSTDFENRIIYWNKGAEKIYGYNQKEITGKIINSDFKLYDAIDIETQIQITQELEKYRNYFFKRKEYRKDGSEIWVEGNVSLICDTGDNPVGLLYIVRDITGKLTSEILSFLNANLQKSLRDLTANLLNDFSFSDILYQFTKKCKELTESEICAVIKINEHKSEILEIHSDASLNQSILEDLKLNAFTILRWLDLNKSILTSFDDTAPEIIEALNSLLGVKRFIIAPVIIKNEIQYFILVGAENYFMPKYKIEVLNSFASLLSFIITYFDKKLLQETLEEKLKQTQKFELASNLISGIVHDFKNLLNGIQFFIDLIKAKYLNLIPSDLIEEIEVLIYRGLDLSKSLLEVGKPLKPLKTEFNLKKLLDEIFSLAVKICPKNIRIIKDYDKLPDIYADYSQLHQVFINLVVNAKDAMPEGGVLRIYTEEVTIGEKDYLENPKIKPGEYIVINFEDTGTGIPKDYLEKIFEPYFTTKDSQKGTGLGLFISQNIISRHNGYILVDSTLGKGTTFKVYLPIIKTEKVEVETMIEQVKKVNPTILLVDDEDAIRNLLAEMLNFQNFEVIEAKSGAEAEEMYEKYSDKIDLVILDYFLKDKTGAEILKFIREKNQNVPVFVATGIMDENIVAKLNALRVDKIIEKPYEFDSLLASINNYIKIVT